MEASAHGVTDGSCEGVPAPLWAAAILSARATSACGRMSVVSLTSDLKQLLRSVMYSRPGYGSCGRQAPRFSVIHERNGATLPEPPDAQHSMMCTDRSIREALSNCMWTGNRGGSVAEASSQTDQQQKMPLIAAYKRWGVQITVEVTFWVRVGVGPRAHRARGGEVVVRARVALHQRALELLQQLL